MIFVSNFSKNLFAFGTAVQATKIFNCLGVFEITNVLLMRPNFQPLRGRLDIVFLYKQQVLTKLMWSQRSLLAFGFTVLRSNLT